MAGILPDWLGAGNIVHVAGNPSSGVSALAYGVRPARIRAARYAAGPKRPARARGASMVVQRPTAGIKSPTYATTKRPPATSGPRYRTSRRPAPAQNPIYQ